MNHEVEQRKHLDLWVGEKTEDFYEQRYRVTETLFSGQSEFQKVDIVQTEGHGKMLFLDGLTMISERDEFIYHDMIAHVPLFAHPNPKRVLVIGGGDGGTAREVLRHEEVETCWMIEIDGMVVEACRQHIPLTSGSFDNPRLKLMIEDGVKFMAETDEKFDVILIDSTDPIAHAVPLFGEDFYANVFRVLTDEGMVVAQGESSYHEPELQATILKSMTKSFPKAYMYNYANMTYPAGFWSFMLGSKKRSPLADFDEERASRLRCKYYNPGVHRAAFALAQFQKERYREYLSEL